MRCRDNRVISTRLKIKPLMKTREGYRIVKQAGRTFLSAQFHETHRKKCALEHRISSLQSRMEIELSTTDY